MITGSISSATGSFVVDRKLGWTLGSLVRFRLFEALIFEHHGSLFLRPHPRLLAGLHMNKMACRRWNICPSRPFEARFKDRIFSIS
jgi:hypothetical protein